MGIPQHLEENELIALLKKREQDAFTYLYRNYSATLYGVILSIIINRDTADDVLQEVFVKIWNNIDKYDASKGRLYTWMVNLTRNAAIDKLRSKGEILQQKILNTDFSVDTSGSRTTEVPTDNIGVRKIVHALKPEQRTVIELAYYSGLTMEEIAVQLEIPTGTVKTRLRAAILKLRNSFNL